MRLLGKSYSFEDVLCYTLGTLAALSTGLSPSTAKVRFPAHSLAGFRGGTLPCAVAHSGVSTEAHHS